MGNLQITGAIVRSVRLSACLLILWNNFKPISICRYESPIPPNLHIFQETAVEAFPMAIVGFAVAFSVAKVYSVKHDYTIDGNQVKLKYSLKVLD